MARECCVSPRISKMIVAPSIRLIPRKNAKAPIHSSKARIACRRDAAFAVPFLLVFQYAINDVSVVRKIVKIKDTSNVSGKPIVNQCGGFLSDSGAQLKPPTWGSRSNGKIVRWNGIDFDSRTLEKVSCPAHMQRFRDEENTVNVALLENP